MFENIYSIQLQNDELDINVLALHTCVKRILIIRTQNCVHIRAIMMLSIAPVAITIDDIMSPLGP